MSKRENPPLIDLRAAKWEAAARRSFWNYRQFMNPAMHKGWWQRMIAHQFQQFFEDYKAGKRPILVIQSPPQHGKSLQVIDLLTWALGQNPDLRMIYTSYSDRLGVRANLRLRRAVTSEKYQRCFPKTRIGGMDETPESKQAQKNLEFVEIVGRDGYFRNTTVLGAVTGEGLDIGVIDDPIKGRKEASSETVRNGVWDWFTDDFFSRFSENAALLVIMTRWHEDDPIGRLRKKFPDAKVVSYPALATENEEHRKVGEPLFPELKSQDFLLKRKAVMYPPYWEALYQQNPITPEGELFKPDRIQVVDAIPAGITKWLRGWDLASTERSKSAADPDYTAGARLGKLPDGRYIIADMTRGQWGPDERDASLVSTASRDGYETQISIPQDPGQAGKTQALYLTRLLAGYRVKTSPESGDKVTRAEPFAAQVNVGNVLMLRGSWNDALIEEMRMFPNGKHDDQIDALSRAFAELLTKRSIYDAL